MIKKPIAPMMYTYQKEATKKSFEHRAFMLALDMGLGKTLTSLNIAQELKYKKIIIICQSGKMQDWEDEVNTYFSLPIVRYNKLSKKKKEAFWKEKHEEQIFITSFGTCWRIEKEILKMMGKDTLVIVDESQKMKTHNSKVGKFGVKLANKAHKILLLSGDPISNGYIDLYNQMRMLGLTMKMKEFKEYFCVMETKKNKGGITFEMIIDYKNVDILLEALHSTSVFIKTEDVIDLPKRNIIDIHLDFPNADYKKTIKHKSYKDAISFGSPGVLMLGLRQMCGGYVEGNSKVTQHKEKALLELLESSTESFIIFYNFNGEKDRIIKVLEKLNLKYFQLNGTINEKEEMKKYKDRKILVTQIVSGSTGHNFQEFSYTIYYSPPTSAGDYKQSLKRTHRVGQTKPCFYYRFITNDTVETRIYDSIGKGVDYTVKMFEQELIGKTSFEYTVTDEEREIEEAWIVSHTDDELEALSKYSDETGESIYSLMKSDLKNK